MQLLPKTSTEVHRMLNEQGFAITRASVQHRLYLMAEVKHVTKTQRNCCACNKAETLYTITPLGKKYFLNNANFKETTNARRKI